MFVKFHFSEMIALYTLHFVSTIEKQPRMKSTFHVSFVLKQRGKCLKYKPYLSVSKIKHALKETFYFLCFDFCGLIAWVRDIPPRAGWHASHCCPQIKIKWNTTFYCFTYFSFYRLLSFFHCLFFFSFEIATF